MGSINSSQAAKIDHEVTCNFISRSHTIEIHSSKQRWEVTKYTNTLLLYYFRYVIYVRISFSDDFLLLLPTFVEKYLYFPLCVEKGQILFSGS